MKPVALIAAACVVAIPALVLALQGAWSRHHPPASLGPSGGVLAACARSLNCVTSSNAAGHAALAPLRHRGSAEEGRQRLLRVLERLPGARIVTDVWPYLHAEFQSRWFGFVDDVEFLADERDGRIDFRSASRVGVFDLGVNRRRMEEIRRQFDGLSNLPVAKVRP